MLIRNSDFHEWFDVVIILFVKIKKIKMNTRDHSQLFMTASVNVFIWCGLFQQVMVMTEDQRNNFFFTPGDFHQAEQGVLVR